MQGDAAEAEELLTQVRMFNPDNPSHQPVDKPLGLTQQICLGAYTRTSFTLQALVNFEAERVPLDAQTDASLAWRSRLLRLGLTLVVYQSTYSTFYSYRFILTFQALVNFEAERVPLDAQTDASLAWRSRLLRLAHLRQRSSLPIYIFNLLFLHIQPYTQALVNFEAERVPLDAQTDASLAWRSRLLHLGLTLVVYQSTYSTFSSFIFNLPRRRSSISKRSASPSTLKPTLSLLGVLASYDWPICDIWLTPNPICSS